MLNTQNLQSKGIDLLKEYGSPEDNLWLVEIQTIKKCSDFYGDYIIWDHTSNSPNNHDYIIYYHENGSIHQHATFDSNNENSFKEAVKYIAKYLKG